MSIGIANSAPDNGPIAYIQRTRDWYIALGYANPYRWRTPRRCHSRRS